MPTNDEDLSVETKALAGNIHGLGHTIYRMHQGIKEKADEISSVYQKQLEQQGRQQKVIRNLTWVIAVATALYTLLTALSLYRVLSGEQNTKRASRLAKAPPTARVL